MIVKLMHYSQELVDTLVTSIQIGYMDAMELMAYGLVHYPHNTMQLLDKLRGPQNRPRRGVTCIGVALVI